MRSSNCFQISKSYLIILFCAIGSLIFAQNSFKSAALLAKVGLNLELQKADPLSQVRNLREELRTVYAKYFDGEGICLNMKWTPETIELDRQRQMLCQIERVLLGETANAYINPTEQTQTDWRTGGTVKYVWVKRAASATLPNITSAENSLNKIGGISATPLTFTEVTTITDTFSAKTGGFDNYYDLQNKANLKNWYNAYGAKLFIGVVENTFSDGYWSVTTIGNCTTNFVNGTMAIRAANTNVSPVSLGIVMAHECGHFFGLVHDDPANYPHSLMNPIVYDDANYMSVWNVNCILRSAGLFNTGVINVQLPTVIIYPTLVFDILNVENSKSFDLVNVLGQVVLTGFRNTVNVSVLNKGLYFVRGIDLNDSNFSIKFEKY